MDFCRVEALATSGASFDKSIHTCLEMIIIGNFSHHWFLEEDISETAGEPGADNNPALTIQGKVRVAWGRVVGDEAL